MGLWITGNQKGVFPAHSLRVQGEPTPRFWYPLSTPRNPQILRTIASVVER